VLQAVTPAVAIDLTQILDEVQGSAYDEVSNRLYFLEKQTGTLKSLQLTPGCEAATPPFCVSTSVATGFDQPSDVAVNAAAGLAYVVASREPALWRVDLKSKATTKIAAGIGTFSQIVLAPEINSAYVTDYFQGNLFRVDLSTGDKPVVAGGLKFPAGLVVNEDRTLAYVADQSGFGGGGVISEINLVTGERTRTVAGSRFGRFGFLAWTDSSESALYALEYMGAGASSVVRVDLVASAKTVVATFGGNCDPQCKEGLSGLAVNPSGSGLYVGLRDKVILLPLKAPPAQRVFLSIGNIPTTSIDQDGFANTASFVDSPFGGTLDIFGNLTLLKATYKADSYRILVSKSGIPGAPVPILASWTAYHWKTTPLPAHYEPELVSPAPNSGRYSIPQDYQSSSTAPFRSPTYLMMRWPTSDYGKYTLQIQIFDSTGKNITNKIPPNQRSLTLWIDNTPPVADLQTIRHGGLDVSPCEIVQTAPNSFDFGLEASDANGHLLGYSLRAVWGRNQSATIFSKSYNDHKDDDGPHLWNGEVDFLPTPPWPAKCNCAHTFTLQVSKRTTNGYSYILSSNSYQSITINNTGNSCQ